MGQRGMGQGRAGLQGLHMGKPRRDGSWCHLDRWPHPSWSCPPSTQPSGEGPRPNPLSLHPHPTPPPPLPGPWASLTHPLSLWEPAVFPTHSPRSKGPHERSGLLCASWPAAGGSGRKAAHPSSQPQGAEEGWSQRGRNPVAEDCACHAGSGAPYGLVWRDL